jgi:hypothetical protein
VLDGQASRIIWDFLDGSILDKSHCLWKDATDAEMQQVRDGLEKFIMNKMYHHLFESTAAARVRDEALFDHIQRLW